MYIIFEWSTGSKRLGTTALGKTLLLEPNHIYANITDPWTKTYYVITVRRKEKKDKKIHLAMRLLFHNKTLNYF